MATESVPLKMLRLGLGALFLFSGALKLSDPGAFRASIAAYELLPEKLGGLLAWYLPALEVVCGTALMLGRARRAAAGIVLALLLIFTMAIASAWLRGLDIRCGCFGSWLDRGSYPWWVARNALLFALTFHLFFKEKQVQVADS